eukprot:12714837-Heterocapsa_arctica.AAC.1
MQMMASRLTIRPDKELNTDKWLSTMQRGKKHMCAHLEKSKFEIPITIPPEMFDLTDVQTNHSFFNGPQVRLKAMNKTSQIQAHKRDKHNKAHNRAAEDIDSGDT